MALFFHVDRGGRVRAGATVGLTPVPDLKGFEAAFALGRAWFPEGVTQHGYRYLLEERVWPTDEELASGDGSPWGDRKSAAIELFLELTRRVVAPQLPSRYQSLFAWDTLGEAERFRIDYPPIAGPGTIYEVEGEPAFRGDMRLVGSGAPLMTVSMAASYWAGDASEKPRWEVLLRPPVQVVRAV